MCQFFYLYQTQMILSVDRDKVYTKTCDIIADLFVLVKFGLCSEKYCSLIYCEKKYYITVDSFEPINQIC